ncbi:MAG: HD domain-containing protein, partial [Clostridia bacterium]|nr:HD domain-containing protein [Clostridia bacterium]
VVANYAELLAERFNADKEVVELAAYLHDFSVIVDPETANEHHIAGADLAERILTEYSLPKDKIEKVKQCILTHSSPIQVGEGDCEAVCLSNADAMAQIAKPAFWLYVNYSIWKNSYRQGVKAYLDWIDGNWKGLIAPAKEYVGDRYLKVKEILY